VRELSLLVSIDTISPFLSECVLIHSEGKDTSMLLPIPCNLRSERMLNLNTFILIKHYFYINTILYTMRCCVKFPVL
jgi:hypothetical protein